MSSLYSISRLALSLTAAAAAFLFAGCGAKEDETASAPPPPAPAQTESEPAPAQEESTTESVSGSGLAATVDIGATMKAADVALKNQDLMKATDALLKLQVSGAINNNPQAKMDHYQRMVELQAAVADAAARGDPKAQQAAALLRQGALGGR